MDTLNPTNAMKTVRGRPLWRTALATLAIATVGWLLLTGAARAQTTPTPPAPTVEPPTEASPCDVSTRMWARPEIVPLGESTDVTATVNFSCPGGATAHQHIALVLDASYSVTGTRRARLVQAMGEFIDRLQFNGPAKIKVAVIEFNTAANVLCDLSDQPSTLRECLGRLATFDSGCIDCGVAAAHQVLVRGRAAVPRGEELTESMIVFTDGANAAGCDALTAEAAYAKNDRIRIVTIALSPGGDVPCMRSAATSPRYFFEARAASQLFNVMDTIRKQLSAAKVQSLVLRFRLAPDMAYVVDSARPSASSVVSDVLVWNQSWLLDPGLTVTLKVRPLVAGAPPVLAAADGEIVDSLDRKAAVAFTIPAIVALGGGVLPTATPHASMPVRTNSLTLSPPSPKAGERARLDYRLALDDPIGPLGSHVMIVADTSGSMADAAATFKAVLHALVARLPLGSDPSMKVGLVAYNSAAKLLTGLSGDRGVVDAAIDELGAAGGTCIDCGLRLGRTALSDGRPAPGVEDVIVFSDGENSSGCAPAVGVANQLKGDGITVHSVCLVNGCDTACMQAIASPGHYHEVARADALGGAFDAIGDVLLSDRRLEAVHLRLLLPPHLRLVPDTFDIAPSSMPNGREGDWTVRPWSRDGMALHGEVEATGGTSEGEPRVAVVLAEGIARDGVVVARSVAEANRPGPTDVPPPPTSTVTSTASTATPTTPIATPTAVAGWYVYLPIAYR